ncbi:MAG TPA: F0F1 ATP synthase subunit epsilon [Caldithrix abyssi]|uniref:ATP synthase epsilon chain n=1 Tax=Caldithrix abyssi TaxID=187145 RepID=A0A7V4U2Q8_CALAY|nr:F0F1 ATP synthase subunit epsilon [Caldithrix abyssi]
MAAELEIEIVTPFGKTYEKTIVSCTVPGALGQFQVLKDHADMLSAVDIGQVRLQEGDTTEKVLATGGGFCEVKNNKVRLIVESAEFAEAIDVERAKKAKERAEKRLASEEDDVDIVRAKSALLRALNRLKTAQAL